MTSKKLIFRSKRDVSFALLLLLFILVVVGVGIVLPYLKSQEEEFSQVIISAVISVLFVGLIIWIWFNTKYKIKNDNLHISTGPFYWNILVTEINTVRLNQQTFGGLFKLSLSWKCIALTYKSTRTVYISPINETEFLAELLKINPNIAIINH
ncbi:PH domain-containing protein [Saccharicrinis sp. FJH54]|uniref:PH domain-containing protein n=1 Tax=Saccharicrinis sp. FJH54 TaxID=3344665 RepID=UPI0035D3F178